MDHYMVKRDAETWVLLKEDEDRAIRRSMTKKELLRLTARYLESQEAMVTVFNLDGTVLDERRYPLTCEKRAGARNY